MIRRLGAAVAAAGLALTGLAAGTGVAAAEPACADVHWIGAAGSGQRDAAGMAASAGMGDVIYASYEDLQADLAADGKTITAEAVNYPAAAVPLDGSIGGWLGFLDSVNVGADAVAAQFASYTQACPTSKVVLAGYSQGAMIVHRNLYDLADNPQVAAALLVADGDRLPADTTIALGSAAGVPGPGMGVAQEHYILASTNTSPLPPQIGARTISVCDVGDPVCDYVPDSNDDVLSPAGLAIHTGYSPERHGWGPALNRLVAASATPAVGAPAI